jgi:hypothetical protein
MTDILIRNFSVARKPRSIRYCDECKEPAYPGIARYRLAFFRDNAEHDAHLHLHCTTKWLQKFVREHRDQLKKEGIK